LSEHWKILLKIAVQILQNTAIPEDKWTMGGGTVLMLYYHHRLSKDIDVFLQDVQYIPFLSPRVNDFTLNLTDEYDEQSNFLKLRFSEGEIDFIVAPNLTGTAPVTMDIDDIHIKADTPEEIIVKKLYYKAEALKVRDFFDIAVTVSKKEKDILNHKDIFLKKLDVINNRWDILKETFPALAEQLDIIDKTILTDVPSIITSFLQKCRQ